MPYIAISIIVLAIIVAVAIYAVKNRIRNMAQEMEKENKPMFWIGIAVVATSVIFFLIAEEEFDMKIWAIPIWIMGIGLIAGSRYRIIK